MPDIPGQETFNGKIIHSRAYKRNTPFNGERLLIVGHGISGREISAQCWKVAKEVRSPYQSYDASKQLLMVLVMIIEDLYVKKVTVP